MGLALAIVFLWVAGLCLWIAFHNLEKLGSETVSLPGVLGAIVAGVKGGGAAAGSTSSPSSAGPGAVMA